MEEMKRLDGDIDFAEEMESSLITLQVGQTVKGRIIRHNSTEVYVDLGYKSDGVIPIEEFASDTDQDPVNNIKIDDMIDVYIVRVNDSEGTVQLSKKRVDEKNNWARIEEAFDNATPIKAVVTDVTNGGLIVTSSGVRVFVPASQVSDRYVEDLRGYIRKPVDLKIIDYNKQKRKFVGSMKALIVEEKKRAAEQLWNDIDTGMEYIGVVKSLTAFGAFVDIGGVDGLVHISELSWGRIRHPSDVVKVGEQISVRVISIDREKKKISLGYRREEDNPWYKIEEKYPVGEIVTKKVVRIAPFGAFVELEKGIDALVHISQISDTRIAKPDDVLHVGMEVTAKITELNLDTKKISMSIKEVEPIPYIPPVVEGENEFVPDEDELPTEYVEEMHTTLGDALGDMFKSVTDGEKEVAAAEADVAAEEVVAVEEVAEVAASEAVEEVAEVAAAEAVEEVAEVATAEAVEEAVVAETAEVADVSEAVKEAVEEAKEAVEEAKEAEAEAKEVEAVEVAETVSELVEEAVVAETAKEATVATETVEEAVVEDAKEGAVEAVEEAVAEAEAETTAEAAAEAVKEATVEAVAEVIEEAVAEAITVAEAEAVVETVLEAVEEAVAEVIVEAEAEAIEAIKEVVVEAVVEEAVEAVEAIIEEVAEAVVEEVVETVAEEVAEAVVEEVAEAVVEEVAEAVEKVAEKAAEIANEAAAKETAADETVEAATQAKTNGDK